MANESADRRAGAGGGGARNVVVQVCVECGKEYMFENADAPPDLACEKCGNKVFRPFYDVAGRDEVHEDWLASTERDLATDDSPEDVTEGDVLDLENL